jgi:hypothetical protein
MKTSNYLIDIKIYESALQEEFPIRILNRADMFKEVNDEILLKPGIYTLELPLTEDELLRIINASTKKSFMKILGTEKID